MSKLTFKNLASEDANLNKQTRIKVEWKPIEIVKEEAKPVIRKSGLKSLKEVYQKELDIVSEQPKEVPVKEIVGSKFTLIEETITEEAVIEEKVIEEIEITTEDIEQNLVEEKTKSIVDKVAEHITKEAKLHEQDSFQQPNPPAANRSLEDVVKKVRSLETWLSKIASHGPGGGDANPFDRVEWVDRGVRFMPTPRMAYWNNTEDCLNITHADGSTLQVGLENYIRVYNNTANTFANGTFVEFRGIDAEGAAPTFRAYINDANAQPLYSIGVLTTDVASNSYGRATVLGLVRDVDTTGNAVGESWSVGDVLWANPAYPGKYTKVKPTSPNVAISVAAVTTVGETDGIILVRPAIWPRLRYGDFFSTLTQVAPAPNVDVRLAISNTLISSGFTLAGNTIVALDSGLYKFQSRAQLTSTSSSSKSLILWYKKNGINIPRSSVRQSIAENGGYRTITNFQLISLDAGDNVSVHFTVTDTNLFVDAPAAFNGAPEVPSIQIAVTEAAL